jgi:hypothetical protein
MPQELPVFLKIRALPNYNSALKYGIHTYSQLLHTSHSSHTLSKGLEILFKKSERSFTLLTGSSKGIKKDYKKELETQIRENETIRINLGKDDKQTEDIFNSIYLPVLFVPTGT